MKPQALAPWGRPEWTGLAGWLAGLLSGWLASLWLVSSLAAGWLASLVSGWPGYCPRLRVAAYGGGSPRAPAWRLDPVAGSRPGGVLGSGGCGPRSRALIPHPRCGLTRWLTASGGPGLRRGGWILWLDPARGAPGALRPLADYVRLMARARRAAAPRAPVSARRAAAPSARPRSLEPTVLEASGAASVASLWCLLCMAVRSRAWIPSC